MKISDKSDICLTPTSLWKVLELKGTGKYNIIVDFDFIRRGYLVKITKIEK